MKKFAELNLNEENQSWLNLLINNEEDCDTFKRKFYNIMIPMDDILKFREYLLKRRLGQNLTANEIDKAFKLRDKPLLMKILSQLFLEPITISEINYYIDSVGISADDLILLHNNHVKIRFSTLLSSWRILMDQDKRKLLKKAI
jgi:hypothetical protein